LSRITKNLLVGFTLLCAVVLAVFCVELVLLNSEDYAGRPGASLSNGLPDGDEENSNGSEAADAEPPDDSEPPEENGDGDDEPPNEDDTPSKGTLFEMDMLDNVNTVTLYANEEIFEYSWGEALWTFTYLGDGKASLEVSIGLLTPQGGTSGLTKELAVHYLDDESPAAFERRIADSLARGVYISGEKNGETYEMWVHGPLVGGNDSHARAVVFVANYQNEEQRAAIYDVLDTLEVVSDPEFEQEVDLEDGLEDETE